MKKLIAWYKQQHFLPSLIAVFFNSGFIRRRLLFKAIQCEASRFCSGRLLDVGCGSKPYQSLFNKLEYIGMDIENTAHPHDNEEVDIYYDGRSFPLESASYDVVLCTEVLEHVQRVDEFVSEIRRVLKPGGCALITVPFVCEEHEKPYDFRRLTSFGIADILSKSDFEIIMVRKLGGVIEVIGQILVSWIWNNLQVRYTIINAIVKIVVLAPLTLFFSLCGYFIRSREDIYLNLFVLARAV